MLEKAFGDVLRTLRKEKGLSQERLAIQSGLDRTYISLLERGLRRPTLRTIFSLAKVLDVTPSAMVREVEKIIPET